MSNKLPGKDLDGSLFAAIQGPIGEKGKLHLKFDNQIINFDPEVLAYPPRETQLIQAILGTEVPPLLSNLADPLIRWVFRKSAYKQLHSSHTSGMAALPKRAKEVLMDGVLTFDATILSPGGSATTSRAYVGAIQAVKNRDGRTSTYGLGRVASGAAAIWQEGDHRFDTGDGVYIWHRGASSTGEIRTWQAYEEDHYQTVTRRFFEGASDGDIKQRVLRDLAQNERGEVRIEARELQNLGLMEGIVKMSKVLDEIPKHSLWTKREIIGILDPSL